MCPNNVEKRTRELQHVPNMGKNGLDTPTCSYKENRGQPLRHVRA